MPKAKSSPPMLTKAQDALVAKWMPLARKLVAKCETGDKADQLSYAMWGLAKFARRFDPTKGYSEMALASRAIGTGLIDCHRAAKRHAGNVELQDHHLGAMAQGELLPPPPKWTPPPDPNQRRRTREPGQSERTRQRMAKRAGNAARPGRGRALDGPALLMILTANRNISTAELARSLGVHRNTLTNRPQNRQLLARCRQHAAARIFDHAKVSSRAPRPGQAPRAAAPPRWG